jgi:hypothetical protein
MLTPHKSPPLLPSACALGGRRRHPGNMKNWIVGLTLKDYDGGVDEEYRILPEQFMNVYEALWLATFTDGVEGYGERNAAAAELERATGKVTAGVGARGARLSSGVMDVVGTRNGGSDKKSRSKVVGKTTKTLKNERNFLFKQKMDKRLRRMGKEILSYLEGSELEKDKIRKCFVCKTYGSCSWYFCPQCGGRMTDED